jgi:hypothetical protein
MRKLILLVALALAAAAAYARPVAAFPPGPCNVEGLWQGVSQSETTGMRTSVQLLIDQHGRQFDWVALDQGGIPLFTGHGVIAASGNSSIQGKTPDGSAIVHGHGDIVCPAGQGVVATFDYHVNMTGGAAGGVQDQGTVQLAHAIEGGGGGD